MVTLRPMTDGEFATYLEPAIESYAAEQSEAGHGHGGVAAGGSLRVRIATGAGDACPGRFRAGARQCGAEAGTETPAGAIG